MEISFLSKRKEYQPAFCAGLTQKIAKEIKNVDTTAVSKKLLKNGIVSDFDNNQTVAWCCNKVVELIKVLNKKYKMNFPLPKGLFVRDFEQLNIDEKNVRAFCNLFPFELYKGSKEVVPERTLFFNNFKTLKSILPEERVLFNWENIDEITDGLHALKQAPTDFFLNTFFHEFAHSIHESRLIKNLVQKSFQNK